MPQPKPTTHDLSNYAAPHPPIGCLNLTTAAASPADGLPHDPYINAVINALATAGLEPDDSWTSSAEIDRYRDDDLYGLATMLDAHLSWTTHTDGHEHGIHLVWEHPAEQWQWAPRRADGVLAHDPEFLPTLPRWARPGAVVATVRDLLAGGAVSTMPSGLWEQHEVAQAALDAWAAAETGE